MEEVPLLPRNLYFAGRVRKGETHQALTDAGPMTMQKKQNSALSPD
jgi:hypothetical protein